MYLTTALPYVNAEPHIGHLYEMVVCDTLARHWRLREDTFFLTGSDEHGTKVAEAARARGVSPQEFVDSMARLYQETWAECGISYDQFVRTTSPEHVRVVREILSAVHAKGDIYYGRYSGLYCTGCERFYTEKELQQGKCPEHLREPERIEEENYFFRMSRYQGALLRHLERHPETIVPDRYRNEVLSLLREQALGDLCISRPKTRLGWGIELPFDERFVTYVWFDALLSYVSGLKAKGEKTFDRFWPQCHHVIGKDIVKPHGVYWPTMLMSAGLPLYRQLHVHGYWTRGESRVSKSLGNVVRPLEVKKIFGMEAFRYFLLREMAYGHDATFTEDALVTRINADLANGLGNLVTRTLSMQHRFFGGRVQPLSDWRPEDRELYTAFDTAAREVPEFLESFAFHRALESIWRAIDRANKYVVRTAPFQLAKDAARRDRAGEVLHHLLEGLRTVAHLLHAPMPETSRRLLALLGREEERPTAALPTESWGRNFQPGSQVGRPEILFPRVEFPGRTDDGKKP
ncbi:MAG: methionine--tRNA ligase [Candidatus Binatia bacterium]|nr:MAG: methionine--tRNA ligase [Candidatus Binatia bacterium]